MRIPKGPSAPAPFRKPLEAKVWCSLPHPQSLFCQHQPTNLSNTLTNPGSTTSQFLSTHPKVQPNSINKPIQTSFLGVRVHHTSEAIALRTQNSYIYIYIYIHTESPNKKQKTNNFLITWDPYQIYYVSYVDVNQS